MVEPPNIWLCVRKLIELRGDILDMERLTVDYSPAGH